MVKVRHWLRFATFLMFFSAQAASADVVLFTNFDGDPFGGNLWTSGGPCSFASCFALEDNFSNDATWNVTGFTFYLVSPLTKEMLESGSRFALFSASGTQIVAPTDVAPVITDMGETFPGEEYRTYKFEISGLDIELVADEYQFRFTNTIQQGIYPGYGSASAQSIGPGFVQLTGSPSVEALLSTARSQRDENWAFQVLGADDTTFENGFEP